MAPAIYSKPVRTRLFWKLWLAYVGLVAVAFSIANYLVPARWHGPLITTSLILMTGAAASLVFSRRYTARVERLKSFSQRIAGGDFRPLAPESPRDELAGLADSLNEAAAQMERTILSLSSERNRSGAILRSMVEGVAVIDAQEKLVFCIAHFPKS